MLWNESGVWDERMEEGREFQIGVRNMQTCYSAWDALRLWTINLRLTLDWHNTQRNNISEAYIVTANYRRRKNSKTLMLYTAFLQSKGLFTYRMLQIHSNKHTTTCNGICPVINNETWHWTNDIKSDKIL